MSHEQRQINRGFHRWIHVIRAESLPEEAFLVEVELLANDGRGCVLAPWPRIWPRIWPSHLGWGFFQWITQ
jgi:hypothetical protein